MRFLFVAVIAAVLVGCTPRPNVSIVSQAEVVGSIRSVYVGSTRRPSESRIFSHRRESTLSFARVDVAIPPAHEPGKVEMPKGTVDPARHFTAAQVDLHADATGFRRDLTRALAARPAKDREALIYVHGFNTTFADGVFRAAQTGHDFDLPGVMVHYSWPSHGNPLGYAYDRDSALFARDGLVELIETAQRSGARRITLVGHSMGAQLVMEALRQISLSQPGRVGKLVDAVVLMSPDIDIDVFKAQARTIGALPQPFVIFVSKKDRALALSARVAARDNRLGNLTSVESLASLNIMLIDVTAFSGADPLNHLTIAASPSLIRMFGDIETVEAIFEGDISGRAGLAHGTVLTVQSATEIVLSPVTGGTVAR